MRNFPGLRVQWLCQLGSVLIVSSMFGACGGKTSGPEDPGLGSGSHGSGDGDGDGDGDPGSGGASSGGQGAAPSGGAVGTGGAASGGAAQGSGGNTGAVPEQCLLPIAFGSCDALFTRYYFDAAAGRCKQFEYGGCDGNANNFNTIEECYDTCLNGHPGPEQSCTAPAECILVFKGCCGPCGDVVPDDFWAINKDFKDDGPWAAVGCDNALCAECVGGVSELGVTCEDNRCVAFETEQD